MLEEQQDIFNSPVLVGDYQLKDIRSVKNSKSFVLLNDKSDLTQKESSKNQKTMHFNEKILNQSESLSKSNQHDYISEFEKSPQINPQQQEIQNNQEKPKGKFEFLLFKIKLQSFARRLLNQTRSRMFKNLTMRQFKLIQDVSCDENQILQKQQNDYKKQNNGKVFNSKSRSSSILNKKLQKKGTKYDLYSKFFKSFLDYKCMSYCTQFLDKYIPVCDPSSILKVIWDVFSIILFSCYYFLIPLFMTFVSQRQHVFYSKLILSVPIFIIVDFIFKTNIGYFEKGRMITKRNNIFYRCFRLYFLNDLIIVLCYLVYIQQVYRDNFPRYFDLLLLSLIQKVNQFKQTLNKLEEHSFFTKKQKNIIALFKLIFILIIIAHILSCLWIGVAEIQISQGSQTWLKVKSFSDIDWYTIYIDAYYFNIVTMITVGYGDIIPYSEEDKIVCIIFMIFSCGIFAYSMNTVGVILQSFNEDKVIMQQNMGIINSYMNRKNVSKQTQNSIREYLEYYWKEESERNQQQEERILGVLSENLRENLLLEGKGVVLKQSAIFRDNFSDVLKQKLVPLIKEYRFTPEEIICTQGDMDDCSIYFIEKGSVNIFVEYDNSHDFLQNQNTKQLITLTAGQSFGEISFFTGKSRTATVRSKEFTTILLIKRQDFLQMVRTFEEDYEQFCNIKDNIFIYTDFQLIDVKCLSCQSPNHQIIQCPYLHFIPNHAKLREQFIQQPQQERVLIERTDKKRLQSLNLIKQNTYYARQFQKFDPEMQDYIDAFLDIDSSEFMNRSDFEEDEISFKQFDDIFSDDKQIQLYGQLNNDEYQKKESSLNQSGYPNGNRLVMTEVPQKLFQTDFTPSKNSVLEDNDSGQNHLNTNSQVLKPRTKHHSIINKDEDAESTYHQRSKAVNSSDRIMSSIGENRKSEVGETIVRNHSKKYSIEDKIYFDSVDQYKQIHVPVTTSQHNISKQRPKRTSLKIQKNQENQQALSKYQFFYNKIVTALMESIQNIQQYSLQNIQVESPSIKKHGSKLTASSFFPSETLLKVVNNNRPIEKKSSFVNKSQMNNSIIVSQRLLQSKHNSIQKPDISQRRLSKLENINPSIVKETTIANETNNVRYAGSIHDIEKDFYEEFDFDCMKNFTYYFPLNNLNHQIELMKLNDEQKRQKMLRNHVENVNFIKKNKNQNIQGRKSKRRSSINSSLSKVQQHNILCHDDELDESNYTKKRSKFYLSQTNQLDRSSIALGDSSKKFEKLDSQYSAAHRKQSHKLNTLNLQNINEIALNKSIKSTHQKLHKSSTSKQEDLVNSLNSLPKDLNKSQKKDIQFNNLDEEDNNLLSSMMKKIDAKDSNNDTTSQYIRPYNDQDNSSYQLARHQENDNQYNSEFTKNQTDFVNLPTLIAERIRKAETKYDDFAHSNSKKGEHEFDINTEYSLRKMNINTNSIKIGKKPK